MTVCYFHLEGECPPNDKIDKPFGFFVHVIIRCKSEEIGRNLLEADLASEGMKVVEFRFAGEWSSFQWDEPELEEQIEKLVKNSEDSFDKPQYSAFESFLLSD